MSVTAQRISMESVSATPLLFATSAQESVVVQNPAILGTTLLLGEGLFQNAGLSLESLAPSKAATSNPNLTPAPPAGNDGLLHTALSEALANMAQLIQEIEELVIQLAAATGKDQDSIGARLLQNAQQAYQNVCEEIQKIDAEKAKQDSGGLLGKIFGWLLSALIAIVAVMTGQIELLVADIFLTVMLETPLKDVICNAIAEQFGDTPLAQLITNIVYIVVVSLITFGTCFAMAPEVAAGEAAEAGVEAGTEAGAGSGLQASSVVDEESLELEAEEVSEEVSASSSSSSEANPAEENAPEANANNIASSSNAADAAANGRSVVADEMADEASGIGQSIKNALKKLLDMIRKVLDVLSPAMKELGGKEATNAFKAGWMVFWGGMASANPVGLGEQVYFYNHPDAANDSAINKLFMAFEIVSEILFAAIAVNAGSRIDVSPNATNAVTKAAQKMADWSSQYASRIQIAATVLEAGAGLGSAAASAVVAEADWELAQLDEELGSNKSYIIWFTAMMDLLQSLTKDAQSQENNKLKPWNRITETYSNNYRGMQAVAETLEIAV